MILLPKSGGRLAPPSLVWFMHATRAYVSTGALDFALRLERGRDATISMRGSATACSKAVGEGGHWQDQAPDPPIRSLRRGVALRRVGAS